MENCSLIKTVNLSIHPFVFYLNVLLSLTFPRIRKTQFNCRTVLKYSIMFNKINHLTYSSYENVIHVSCLYFVKHKKFMMCKRMQNLLNRNDTKMLSRGTVVTQFPHCEYEYDLNVCHYILIALNGFYSDKYVIYVTISRIINTKYLFNWKLFHYSSKFHFVKNCLFRESVLNQTGTESIEKHSVSFFSLQNYNNNFFTFTEFA